MKSNLEQSELKLLVLDLMTRSPSFITLLPNRENFLQETFSQLHFNNIQNWLAWREN